MLLNAAHPRAVSQSEKEYPPSNITLKNVNEAWVTVLSYSGGSERVSLGDSNVGTYKRLLETILEERQAYNPRVYIKT